MVVGLTLHTKSNNSIAMKILYMLYNYPLVICGCNKNR